MKKYLAIVLLAFVSCSAFASCEELGEIAYMLTKNRNQGVPVDRALNRLLDLGADPRMAVPLIELIYTMAPQAAPTEIRNAVKRNCETQNLRRRENGR